ncbi:MAG: DUF4189 domain-containing protein [Gammaproteobacteria bacterium]|nr:DUF4189 domain-containing protein [Gammaproteobacteria bacterium]
MRHTLTLALTGTLLLLLSGCSGSGGIFGPLGSFGTMIASLEPNCSGVIVGIAWDASSPEEADSGALTACRNNGGTRCSASEVLQFGTGYAGDDTCAAVAYGTGRGACRIRGGQGPTESAAEAEALQDCRVGGFSCGIVDSPGGPRASQCSR